MQLDRPLTIVTGKGGVGRSAVAAALATVSAAADRRVLVLSIGDGTGLAAHFTTGEPRVDPEPVADGIWAARVDPVAALEEYIRLRVGPVPIRLAGRLFGAVAQTVPGIRDVVVMGKCLHEASEGRWDHVVVDAAPTGQIESLLGAPAVIGDLVGRGPVHDQARHLEAQLSDSGLTALVAVATPGELALTEAAEFLVASRRMGLAAPVRIVLNRLITEPAFTAPPEASGSQRDAAVLTLRLFDRQQTLLRGWEHPDASLPFVHGADPPAVRRTMAEVLGS